MMIPCKNYFSERMLLMILEFCPYLAKNDHFVTSFTYSNQQACHLDTIKEFIGDVLLDKGAILIHLKMNLAPSHGIVQLDFFS